jgi:hypothetical protein
LLRNTGGSRTDVKAYGLWANGMWTVEVQRALDTGANAIKDGDKVDQVFVSLVIIESREYATSEPQDRLGKSKEPCEGRGPPSQGFPLPAILLAGTLNP